MATKPNRKTIRRFLETLTSSNVPDGHFLNVWTLPAKRSLWFAGAIDDTVENAVLAEAYQAEAVYVGLGLTRHSLGPDARAKNAEISGIFGLWADLDVRGPGHKKTNLPPDMPSAKALLAEMGLEPTLVVSSGHGLQAYWLFREPWLFENDEERAAAASLAERWTKTLRLRAKAHGWDVDATFDLARVFRVAGTLNMKTLPHVLAEIEHVDEDRRYDSNDFEAHILVDAEKTDKKTSAHGWTFTVNLGAEPPAEKFLLLCQYDPKFLETYNKNRPEWQDQSLSSFDLALATRAFVANWNAQEVVNLLIAFRRKHGGDPKKHQWDDYYRRTLDKAMSGKTEELRARYSADMKEGKELPAEADVLETASEALGVKVTNPIQIDGTPSRWELTINGKVVSLTEEEMTSQTKFRNRLFQSEAGVFPNPLKPAEFYNVIQKIGDKRTRINPGREATERGSVVGWLRDYLSLRCFEADKWDDALEHEVPVFKGDRIFFKFSAFKKHIRTYQHERIGQTELSQELSMIPGHVDEGPQNYNKKRGERSTRELRSVPKQFLSYV